MIELSSSPSGKWSKRIDFARFALNCDHTWIKRFSIPPRHGGRLDELEGQGWRFARIIELNPRICFFAPRGQLLDVYRSFDILDNLLLCACKAYFSFVYTW
jgi:hypothetical protein